MLESLFEKRFHVSQTPPAWVMRLVGMDTAAGVDVNAETAMSSSAVYACVRILAESVASLPLITYRRLENGGKERAPDYFLYNLLHDEPNPEMTSFEFYETLMGHLTLWGNAYAEIEMTRGGKATALWPLRPDRTRLARENGGLYYYTKINGDGPELRLPAERVLHVRGLGSNGLVGLSPIQQVRQAIGLALATEEFGSRFFGNGARPGSVLEHPGKLNNEAYDRLKKSFEDRHQGLENAHRVAILEEGMKLHEVGIPPEDAQFLETRKFQTLEIARIYRIPPHMLADLERSTLSNIEHMSIEFVTNTLRPWLVRWEKRVKASLIPKQDREKMFAEFLVDSLLRGDTASRYQAYATGRQNGWLSVNDIRSMENMNPVDGGDEYLTPLNMVPIGTDQTGQNEEAPSETDDVEEEPAEDERSMPLTQPSPPAPLPILGEGGRSSTLLGEGGCTCGEVHSVGAQTQPIELRKADTAARKRHKTAQTYRAVFADAVKRINRREANDIRAAVGRFIGRRDVTSFNLWLTEFYNDHQEFIYRQMDPPSFTYGELIADLAWEEIGVDLSGLDDGLKRFVRSLVAAYASRHSIEHQEQVRKIVMDAIQAGNEPDLEPTFENWTQNQPDDDAREETNFQGNATSMQAYLQAGVETTRWATMGDSCPYCKSLNGRTASITKAFLDAGEFMPEGAEIPLSVKKALLHAPAHKGCDCITLAALGG